MTSSNRNIIRVTGPLCGEFTGRRLIPITKAVPRSFDVFFDMRMNKRLSTQSWGWWFETQSFHYDVTVPWGKSRFTRWIEAFCEYWVQLRVYWIGTFPLWLKTEVTTVTELKHNFCESWGELGCTLIEIFLLWILGEVMGVTEMKTSFCEYRGNSRCNWIQTFLLWAQ